MPRSEAIDIKACLLARCYFAVMTRDYDITKSPSEQLVLGRPAKSVL